LTIVGIAVLMALVFEVLIAPNRGATAGREQEKAVA
jgi:hypothetical protein